jgi:DNA-binding transcriptional LysR family regulator
MREEGSSMRQMILKHLEEHCVKFDHLKISLVLGSTESIIGAVADGVGVSIVSSWSARQAIKCGVVKATTFKDLKFHWNFSIISPKRNYCTNTAKEFLNFLKVYPLKAPLP